MLWLSVTVVLSVVMNNDVCVYSACLFRGVLPVCEMFKDICVWVAEECCRLCDYIHFCACL